MNVIVILVDDLGWADLSCQGSTFYRTPHIDRLAAEGARFTHAYAACAVCSPTRAAVMTGRSPARLGITDWIRPPFRRPEGVTRKVAPTAYVGGARRPLLCPPNPFWMEHEEVTLAELLREAGHRTAAIGKWHLGDEDWWPKSQGFDVNHGGCAFGQPPSYFDPFVNKRFPKGIPTLPARKKGEYLTDREGDEAAAFIGRNKNRPFFLYYAPYAVHTPIQAKPDLTAVYRQRPKTRQSNPKYAAMIHSLDEAVGKIYAACRTHGVLERTFILFTSDNGGLRGPTHNAPLRSGKGYPYEGGIRVPLLVRWPGVVEPGVVHDALATSVDILPTVLDVLDRPLPTARPLDGVSLTTVLRSQGKVGLQRQALFWHFPHYRGKIVPYSIVRRGPWKLIRRYDTSSGKPPHELFHLGEDLGEERDRAKDKPKLVRELDLLLTAHLKAVGARLPRPNPGFRQPKKR